MKLNLSYVAARERSSGRIFFLAETSALVAGSASAQVAHLAELFRSGTSEGNALRSKYSHVLVIIDNQERQSFEFPDPAHAEVERLELHLAEAQKEVSSVAAVTEKAREAASNVKALEAQRKSAMDRADWLQKALVKARAGLAAVPVVAPAPVDQHESAQQPATPPPVSDYASILASLSDADLLSVAAEYSIDATPFTGEAFQKGGVSTLDREGLEAAILAVAK